MKKYILSATLALAASTSALAGKENSHDLDFYIGKTFLYSQENFNSEIQGRVLYEDGDQEVVSSEKVKNQIKTQGTIITPLAWDFADLNHKIGGKFFFAIGHGFSVGLEISSINPLNFAFEDLTTSKYTASEDMLNSMFNLKVVRIKDNKLSCRISKRAGSGKHYNVSVLELGAFLDETDSLKVTEIDEATFNLFGFSEFKLTKLGAHTESSVYTIQTSDNAAYNSNTLDPKRIAKFKELKAKINNLATPVIFQDAIIKELVLPFKDAEGTKAIKTVFASPSIRYNKNLNDNFDFNLAARFGFGLLWITEKVTKEIAKNINILEAHTAVITSTQNDWVMGGGLEASLKYNISNSFSAGINFSVNAYGNIPKAVDFKVYRTDDSTQANCLSLINFEKAHPEEQDEPWFGLIDATVSIGATIKL